MTEKPLDMQRSDLNARQIESSFIDRAIMVVSCVFCLTNLLILSCWGHLPSSTGGWPGGQSRGLHPLADHKGRTTTRLCLLGSIQIHCSIFFSTLASTRTKRHLCTVVPFLCTSIYYRPACYSTRSSWRCKPEPVADVSIGILFLWGCVPWCFSCWRSSKCYYYYYYFFAPVFLCPGGVFVSSTCCRR